MEEIRKTLVFMRENFQEFLFQRGVRIRSSIEWQKKILHTELYFDSIRDVIILSKLVGDIYVKWKE